VNLLTSLLVYLLKNRPIPFLGWRSLVLYIDEARYHTMVHIHHTCSYKNTWSTLQKRTV